MSPEIEVLQKNSKWPHITGIFLVLITISLIVLFHFIPTETIASVLVSPIEKSSKLAIAANIWFPKSEILGSEKLHLSAKAAFLIETNSGEVLYEQNAKERLPIASLTKIMTVIVALEHKDFNDTFTISSQAAATEPDKMYLIGGEKLTLEELLNGIFLISANDAAEAIAEDTTGNREEFISLMNQKSLQLGMNDTLFINPSGLQEDHPSIPNISKPQYSTAYDVALMSRYAIKKWPHLTDISSQPKIFLSRTDTHQDYDLNNGINLLTTYPGVVGFKTGYTPDAGLTLVTVARRGDKEVIGVLLGCTNRRDDAKMLLDYGFKKLGI